MGFYKKTFFFSIAAGLTGILFGSLFMVSAPPAKEADALGLTFGGRILMVTPCLCAGEIMVTIGPPKGGNFTFGVGSILYQYGQIYRPGPWAKGTYLPGAVCMYFTGSSSLPCVPLPAQGRILQVGTSLY